MLLLLLVVLLRGWQLPLSAETRSEVEQGLEGWLNSNAPLCL